LNKNTAIIIVMGLFSGSPSNAVFAKEAVNNNFISANDASYGNILDAREQAEIKSQEESVEAASARAIVEDKQ
jgi:hypothetical protein